NAIPSANRLKALGVDWYPGKLPGELQEEELQVARRIGESPKFRFAISNQGPDEDRISVRVRWRNEGFDEGYWIEPNIECNFYCLNVEDGERQAVKEWLIANLPDIRQAWRRFCKVARKW